MRSTKKISHIVAMCVFSFFLLLSCDKDVSDVGGDILNNTSIVTEERNDFSIETGNISLERIQSNLLIGGRPFGTAKNDKTGDVSYGVLFRVEPTSSTNFIELTSDPVEGETKTIKLKSANLIVPYSYRSTATASPNEVQYEITNILNEGVNLQFDVFKSEFNLEISNNSSNDPQLYFANASADGVNSFKTQIEAGGSILEELTDVNPKSESFLVKTVDDSNEPITNIARSNIFEEAEKTLRVKLKNDFLGDEIINVDGTVKDFSVLNTEDFLKKFRGVYIKPEGVNNNLVRLFDNSVTAIQPKIEVTFEVTRDFPEIADNDGKTMPDPRAGTKDQIIDFNMNQQIVSIIDSEEVAGFNTADVIDNKELVAIKGGVYASSIKIFNDNNKLIDFFEEKPIINQAVLRLYVNTDSPFYTKENVPNNLLINRLNNGGSVSATEISSNGLFYDFTITQFVKGILNVEDKDDLADANLDLIVGVEEQQINSEIVSRDQITRSERESLLVFEESKELRINVSSLQSIKEVPLYGSDAEQEKRPQLLIKYTVTK